MAGDTTSKNHRPLQKDITKTRKLVINFLTRVGGFGVLCRKKYYHQPGLACLRLDQVVLLLF